MGLDTFETDGPRTWTEKKSSQTDLSGNRVSEFEDEWGIPLHEASEDEEFLAERIQEADSIQELCEMFMWIEHTLVSKAARLVHEDYLEVEDIPEVTHPHYNEHEIEWYIDQYNKNQTIGSTTTSRASSTSNDSDDSETGGALSAFKS